MKTKLLLSLATLCLSIPLMQAQITIQSTNFALSATVKDSATIKVLRKPNPSLIIPQGNAQWYLFLQYCR